MFFFGMAGMLLAPKVDISIPRFWEPVHDPILDEISIVTLKAINDKSLIESFFLEDPFLKHLRSKTAEPIGQDFIYANVRL